MAFPGFFPILHRVPVSHDQTSTQESSNSAGVSQRDTNSIFKSPTSAEVQKSDIEDDKEIRSKERELEELKEYINTPSKGLSPKYCDIEDDKEIRSKEQELEELKESINTSSKRLLPKYLDDKQ